MAATLLALLMSSAARAGEVSVSQAWIRLLPGNLPAGAYCAVINNSDHAVTLTGASAPDFKNAMLHKSITQNGMDKMVHVARIPIQAGQRLRFAPGGYHIMLMPPHKSLKPDERTQITLKFADGQRVTAPFEVKGAGAMNGD